MSANRGLVTRRAFSNSVRTELFEKFERIAEETRIPKSKLLDEAIELLIKKHSKESK